MWGLDQTDPRVAIAAMQAMNASVRNAVFFPAFFLTPVVLVVTAAATRIYGQNPACFCFLAAAVVYLAFGLILTIAINVPMNEALAELSVPSDIESARKIWESYSASWQFWNQMRTIASGIALILACLGLSRLRFSTSEGCVPPSGVADGFDRRAPAWAGLISAPLPAG